MSLTPDPYATPAPNGDQVSPPTENVQRGTALALIIIPAGIIVWIIIWSIGFIASIVAFGVAIGAMALYRFGAGGRISRTGAIRVTIIVIITMVLAIIGGLIFDGVQAFSQISGLNYIQTFTDARFQRALPNFIASDASANALSLVLAAAFTLLGCFSTLRSAFRQTAPAGAPVAGGTYLQPGAAPSPYTQPGAGIPAVPEAPSAGTTPLPGETANSGSAPDVPPKN